jgi:hypothetical protein
MFYIIISLLSLVHAIINRDLSPMGAQCSDNDSCQTGFCVHSICFAHTWTSDFRQGLGNFNVVQDAFGKPNRAFGWFEDEVVMRVTYPEASSIPSRSNIGGSGFYAQPLDLTRSSRIWLEYDVFFPVDFDFVLVSERLLIVKGWQASWSLWRPYGL